MRPGFYVARMFRVSGQAAVHFLGRNDPEWRQPTGPSYRPGAWDGNFIHIALIVSGIGTVFLLVLAALSPLG